MDRRSFLTGVGGAAGAMLFPDLAPGVARSSAPTAGQGTGCNWSEFDKLRREFLMPADFAYFNTAGLGASPRAVTDRVKAAMDRDEASPSPVHSEEVFTRIRGKCAALLGPGCGADEIAFVSSATEGINHILNGLPLGRGDEVITTTHEHPALNIPLLRKMQTAGIVIRTFEPDLRSPSGNVDRIRALVGPKTRLIFVSHVTCTTGQVLPDAAIGRLAREHRLWFALDGAQSLGQFQIDIHGVGAHFYTASCHKWLMGPKRTGILWIDRDHLADLSPTVVGAYSDGGYSLPERRLALHTGAQRFEYGTQNVALIYGLEAAVDLVQGLGLDCIRQYRPGNGRALPGRHREHSRRGGAVSTRRGAALGHQDVQGPRAGLRRGHDGARPPRLPGAPGRRGGPQRGAGVVPRLQRHRADARAGGRDRPDREGVSREP